ncbi:MAG: hypothetical protein J6X58_03345 [Bacteroidales bacterium]|nr:hypothetical protein [Bacteroidales bacterium]
MIAQRDLMFSGVSVVDTVGRVFEYQGNIYRLIYKKSEKECLELLNCGLIDKLVDLNYFPKTNIDSQLEIEGHPLVLKHERCSIINHYEWSFEMFKDAAIHILKVNEICNKYGYELKDGHPLNITFQNSKPVFLDFGSFIKKNGNEWSALDEYLQKCYLPLLLWKEGEYSILRNILESPDLFSENRLLPQQDFVESTHLQHFLIKCDGYKIRIAGMTFFSKNINFPLLIKIVNKASIIIRGKKIIHIEQYREKINPTIFDVSQIHQAVNSTEWCEYQDHKQSTQKYPRFSRITELIGKYCSDAKTAVDLAGNGGILSIILNETQQFNHIFTVDYDGNAIDKAYSYFKEQSDPIDPVYANVVFPFDANSFRKRIQSDLAIACAITHHLILRQNIPLYAIFEKFASYCKKYLIIEFMPLGLWNGHDAPPIPDWYTREWFRNTFCQYFELLHEEQLETNRIVFIGRKRIS